MDLFARRRRIRTGNQRQGVIWSVSRASIDELDKAAGVLDGDATWLERVSANSGCFVDGAEQLILRRVG